MMKEIFSSQEIIDEHCPTRFFSSGEDGFALQILYEIIQQSKKWVYYEVLTVEQK